MTYYSEIRWLSRGACLQRFYSLLDEIKLFVEMKDHHVPELSDELWLQDFAFLVDITTHHNELNTKLQGKDQLVTHLYEHIKAFQVKLRLWEKQLHENKSDHFHRLRKLTGISTNLNRYAEEITTLRAEFSERMASFDTHQEAFTIIASPFTVDLEQTTVIYQMELAELQCNSNLKEKFINTSLLEFYRLYLSKTMFPNLHTHALKIATLFGSTYICEQFFSTMKLTKTKARTNISDFHLVSQLRVATSSIRPDISMIVMNTVQCQVSH